MAGGGKNPRARIRECKSHSCSRSAQAKKILKSLLTNSTECGTIKIPKDERGASHLKGKIKFFKKLKKRS